MGTHSLQSCPTLCGHMDYSLPDSSLLGNLQARILEWVAMPSSTYVSYISLAGGLFTTGTTWEAASPCLLLLLSRFSRVRLCATP